LFRYQAGKEVKELIEALSKSSAGLDIHKETVMCTVLREEESGQISKQTAKYLTYRKQLRELANWLNEQDVEVVVMESTGVYWKTVFEVLEEKGLNVFVVNSQHIKKVPGRKTDVLDSEWLAELARCGLLKASFIPPKDLRQLRVLTRYRRKLTGYLAGEKNRQHKVLEDCGYKISCVVSDINGVTAKQMIKALMEGGQSPEEIALRASTRLRKKERNEIELALDGHMSDRHRSVLQGIQKHIAWLEMQIQEIDEQVGKALQPHKEAWDLLQTIPGLDAISAAMLLAEIGTDMNRFGSKERLSSWAGMCPGNNASAGKKRVAERSRAMDM
jgi:transposase